MCVSVKYRRPNRWTDQIWHAYADGPGDGSYLNKLTSPPKGGSKWEFRGSKNQKSGKCHELSRQSIKFVFFNPSHLGGGVPGGGVGGQHFKSPVNFMNCRENRKKIPPPTKGGRSGNFRGSKNQKSGKCHELPRKVINKLTPPHPTRGWEFYRVKISNVRHFMNSRKSIFLLAPPHPIRRGEVRGEHFKVTISIKF